MNKKILTKIVIIVLALSILINNMYLGVFIKAAMPNEIIENKESVDVDLSTIPNIYEEERKSLYF